MSEGKEILNPFSPKYQSQLKKDRPNLYVPIRPLKQYPPNVHAKIGEHRPHFSKKASI